MARKTARAQGHKKENDNIISQAFAELYAELDRRCEAVLLEIMPLAMEDALMRHDDRHTQHVFGGHDYGWIVCRYGKEIARGSDGGIKTQTLRTMRAKAKELLSGYRWGGLLLAGMEGFYSWNYEIDILTDTREYVRGHILSDYFKKVA